MTMRAVSVSSASARFLDFEASLSSMRRTTPAVCSNWATVLDSWSSRTRRSVMTMTLSNTGLSNSSWSTDRRCESQAIEFDFPEPAECWKRYLCPAPCSRAWASA